MVAHQAVDRRARSIGVIVSCRATGGSPPVIKRLHRLAALVVDSESADIVQTAPKHSHALDVLHNGRPFGKRSAGKNLDRIVGCVA